MIRMKCLVNWLYGYIEQEERFRNSRNSRKSISRLCGPSGTPAFHDILAFIPQARYLLWLFRYWYFKVYSVYSTMYIIMILKYVVPQSIWKFQLALRSNSFRGFVNAIQCITDSRSVCLMGSTSVLRLSAELFVVRARDFGTVFAK